MNMYPSFISIINNLINKTPKSRNPEIPGIPVLIIQFLWIPGIPGICLGIPGIPWEFWESVEEWEVLVQRQSDIRKTCVSEQKKNHNNTYWHSGWHFSMQNRKRIPSSWPSQNGESRYLWQMPHDSSTIFWSSKLYLTRPSWQSETFRWSYNNFWWWFSTNFAHHTKGIMSRNCQCLSLDVLSLEQYHCFKTMNKHVTSTFTWKCQLFSMVTGCRSWMWYRWWTKNPYSSIDGDLWRRWIDQ